MRNDTSFTMVAPNAGFTSRVLARIAEHERAQARRRALIGSAVLVVFALTVLALVGWWLFSWVAVFVTTPQLIVSVINALATVAFWAGVALNGLGTAVSLVAQSVGVPQMLSLAMIVCVLTMLWLRVVVGSSLSSQTLTVGGSK
jgi:uncharacterized membrane protein